MGHGEVGDYDPDESPGPQQVGQLIPGLLWLAVPLMQQNEKSRGAACKYL